MPGQPVQTGAMTVLPKVAILLCTYNGQDHLEEQLDSFAAQEHTAWEVWASDDGSKDNTCAILHDYQQKWPPGRLSVRAGPEKGYVRNFLSLACDRNIKATYYAYSDQDDIWEPGKLARAVSWLDTVPTHVPALYCARSRLVDEHNNEIGLSPIFSKQPSFANALTQNIGGGNTMMFNEATRQLLCEAGKDLDVVSHDWWAYMVVSGCGGNVYYDTVPTLRYRQHSGNVIGMHITWTERLRRLLWQGLFRQWNDKNIAALQTVNHQLTLKNRKILECFSQAREMGLIPRLVYLVRSGIYRQTLLGNTGLIVAAIFKKI